jgi:hypothetical protein
VLKLQHSLAFAFLQSILTPKGSKNSDHNIGPGQMASCQSIGISANSVYLTLVPTSVVWVEADGWRTCRGRRPVDLDLETFEVNKLYLSS